MPKDLRAGFPTYWQTMGAGPLNGLLIHCSLAQSGAWAGMMAELSDQMTAIAFDLPGHGQSADWNDEGDFQTLACSIAADILDEPAHIIGHSFGATIALRLAIEQPALVKSLTLIEPVYFVAAKGTSAFAQYLKDFQPFAEAIRDGHLSEAAAAFTAIWGTGVDWQHLSQNQRTDVTKRIHLIPAGNSAIFEDAAGEFEARRLESLSIPTLLIEGEKSPQIISIIMGVLEHRLQNTTRRIIKSASHMAPITHATEVAGAISDFQIDNDQL